MQPDPGGESTSPSVHALYDELRALAHAQLARESRPATLRTTELVHEAWLRMAGHPEVVERGRAYFFGAAARAMRRILLDAARRRKALRRGGGVDLLPLSGLDPGPGNLPPGWAEGGGVETDWGRGAGGGGPRGEGGPAEGGWAEQLLELDDALTTLEAENSRLARVVELRFFGGLTVEETAEALGVSPRTVKGDWAVARLRLREALGDGP